TPYEILNGRKPNLAKLQPWGCKVRVHDTSGSKLDGRSKIGQWMGFDVKTKDGHRIYWPERRTVTVERSVRFNVDDKINVGNLPLEGERAPDDVEQQEPNNIIQSTLKTPAIQELSTFETSNENITQPDIVEPIQPSEGRGRRIRKESLYVKMLKEGAGVTGEKSTGLLPKGMQTGSMASDVGEIEIEDYAMATVMGNAEGIEPTYEEARKHSDWPK
ncbi:hypothetical protein BYT27DRAFT_7062695, partial [Phlegmacium glaucopus]